MLYTDIGRDGMRTGPNLDATARLARELAPCAVIASGGVSRIEDLDALVPTGAVAVVIGKAFYEGAFTVEQALARVGSAQEPLMLCKRVIPCLDVDAGRVKKGVRFKELRDAGDPVAVAAAYDAQGADEICFLDITASSDGRATTLDMVRATAERVFLPLTVGGGVRAVEDVRALLLAGADKVGINTAAVADPDLVRRVGRRVRQPGDRRRRRRAPRPRAAAAAGRSSPTAGASRPASTRSPGASAWRPPARARSC